MGSVFESSNLLNRQHVYLKFLLGRAALVSVKLLPFCNFLFINVTMKANLQQIKRSVAFGGLLLSCSF